jgi:4-cresol dehydrogenase (hydroxylating)
LYGPSAAAVQPTLERIRKHFLASGKARYISAEEAQPRPIFQAAINSNSGRPAGGELNMLNWRPGLGAIWMTPGAPMVGAMVNEFQRRCRAVASEFGLEYVASFVCGARFGRGIHAILYDRDNADEAARADRCYRKMATVFMDQGVFVGRSPTAYQSFHQDRRSREIVKACDAIKHALDPNNIIAPGRYGIGA